MTAADFQTVVINALNVAAVVIPIAVAVGVKAYVDVIKGIEQAKSLSVATQVKQAATDRIVDSHSSAIMDIVGGAAAPVDDHVAAAVDTAKATLDSHADALAQGLAARANAVTSAIAAAAMEKTMPMESAAISNGHAALDAQNASADGSEATPLAMPATGAQTP